MTFSLCELNYRDADDKWTMAEGSIFASLEDDDILKIIDDKDTKATKNMIAGAARILHEYLQVKDGQFKTI